MSACIYRYIFFHNFTGFLTEGTLILKSIATITYQLPCTQQPIHLWSLIDYHTLPISHDPVSEALLIFCVGKLLIQPHPWSGIELKRQLKTWVHRSLSFPLFTVHYFSPEWLTISLNQARHEPSFIKHILGILKGSTRSFKCSLINFEIKV